MSLHSINHDQKVYVLKHGNNGYTCLGFEYADDRMRKVAAWAGIEGARGYPPGTAEHFAEYERVMREGAEFAARTGKRCGAELSNELIGREGRWVEVVDKYGARRQFIVGKSTGWLPVHLEIKPRRSMGGGAVTGTPFQSVRVVG